MVKISGKDLLINIMAGKYGGEDVQFIDSLVVDGDLVITLKDLAQITFNTVVFNGKVSVLGTWGQRAKATISFISCRLNDEIRFKHVSALAISFTDCRSKNSLNFYKSTIRELNFIDSDVASVSIDGSEHEDIRIHGLRLSGSFVIDASKANTITFYDNHGDIKIDCLEAVVRSLGMFNGDSVERAATYDVNISFSTIWRFRSLSNVKSLKANDSKFEQEFFAFIGNENNNSACKISSSVFGSLSLIGFGGAAIQTLDSIINTSFAVSNSCMFLEIDRVEVSGYAELSVRALSSITIDKSTINRLYFVGCHCNWIRVRRTAAKGVEFTAKRVFSDSGTSKIDKNIIEDGVSFEFCEINEVLFCAVNFGHADEYDFYYALLLRDSSIDNLVLSDPQYLLDGLESARAAGVDEIISNEYLAKYGKGVYLQSCKTNDITIGYAKIDGPICIAESVVNGFHYIQRKSYFQVNHASNASRFDFSVLVNAIEIINSTVNSSLELVHMAILSKGDVGADYSILIKGSDINGSLILANDEGCATYVDKPLFIQKSRIDSFVISGLIATQRLVSRSVGDVYINLDKSVFGLVDFKSEISFNISVRDTKILDLEYPGSCVGLLMKSVPFNKELYKAVDDKYQSAGEARLANAAYVAMRRAEMVSRSWFGTKAWFYFLDITTEYGTNNLRLFILLALMFLSSILMLSNPENIQPTTEALHTYEHLKDHSIPRDWGLVDSVFVALRYMVPMINNMARTDWEPSSSKLLFYLTPEDIMNVFLYLCWVIWPLLLASISGFIRK